MDPETLRTRISATLMANSARDYPTRVDAVMAEVQRYLDDFEADFTDAFEARLPEIVAAEQKRIAEDFRSRTTESIAAAIDVPVELLAPYRFTASGALRLPNGEEITVPPPPPRSKVKTYDGEKWVNAARRLGPFDD